MYPEMSASRSNPEAAPANVDADMGLPDDVGPAEPTLPRRGVGHRTAAPLPTAAETPWSRGVEEPRRADRGSDDACFAGATTGTR